MTVRVAELSDIPEASGDEAGAGWLDEQAPSVKAARASAAMARTRVEMCTCSSIRLDHNRCVGKPNLGAIGVAFSSYAPSPRTHHSSSARRSPSRHQATSCPPE